MNPEVFRNIKDRRQMPYTNVSRIKADLDELTLKKQLPLHQQTIKSSLRYKTTMTKFGLPNQNDIKASTQDLSAFSQNVIYNPSYSSSAGVNSVANEISLPVQIHQVRNNQHNTKHSFFMVNPYSRPVSASEIAASVQSNRIKHALSASLGVSSLPEMSSVGPLPQTLQRNTFLRPMSETFSHEFRHASSNLGTSTYTIKQDSSDAAQLQRQSSNDSDISVKSQVNKNTTTQDQCQSVTQTPTSNIMGASENISLKIVPSTNPSGGLIYYKRFSDPRTSSIVVSGNTNSSNLAWQNMHDSPNSSGGLSVSHLGHPSVLPSSNSNFDKFFANVQPRIKSSTQSTRTDVIPPTNKANVKMDDRSTPIIKYEKTPVNVNSLMGNIKTLTAASKTNKKISAHISKLPLEDHSQEVFEKKVSVQRNSLTSATEQRSSGDGIPSDAKRLSETLRTETSKAAINLNVEGDDCSNGADDDDDFSGSLTEDEDVKDECKSNESSKGERLPGDGEANSQVAVDEDEEELENFECDAASDAALDSPKKNANFTNCGRPVTTDSTHLHTQENARLHKDLRREMNRPSTVTESDIVKPAFRLSLFHNIPPTLNFVLDGERTESLPLELSRQLKWKMSPITPTVVKAVVARSGFRITKKNYDWLGCFGKHMKSSCFRSLHDFQKLNHFPGSFQIGRKDKLWRSLSKMQIHFGKQEFNFFPQTFVLPTDVNLLKQTWEENNTKQKWIIKPPASARGIGIRVISKWSQIPKRKPVIVQKYIHRPFLINASKFDMRIYVYVSCYDPLRLYVYEDGLARFASMRYSSSSKTLNNKYIHLTNYSVNKTNSDYLKNSDSTLCQGHKWSLKALWNYMKRQGINTNLIWETIGDLIIKTIISGDAVINSMTKSNTVSRYCCHELFGFDILLDENFKPWILEVNISPSLHSNSQLDLSIKGAMIKDMMNIAGFRLPDEKDVSSGSHLDLGDQSPLNSFCIDKRLFTNQLSPDERAKHAFYCHRYMDELINLALLGDSKSLWACTVLKTSYLHKHLQAISSILNVLTPDDVRLLCESIDEDTRKGNFQRLFPTPRTHTYLRYFETPRYYNLLLDQWVLHYNHKEQKGIKRLQSLCEKGIHLQNPTTDPQHQWNIPKFSYVIQKSSEVQMPSHLNSARESDRIVQLYQNLNKFSLKSELLPQYSSRNSESTKTSSFKQLPNLSFEPVNPPN